MSHQEKILPLIEIVNLRNCPDFGTREGDIRVDRTTKWGNPYKMEKESDREEVLRLYETWISNQIIQRTLDTRELIGARRLGCWCSPKACHAEILRDIIEAELTLKEMGL